MTKRGKSKTYLSSPVAIKFTFTPDTKRVVIDGHFGLICEG